MQEEQPVAPQDGVGPLAVAPEPAGRHPTHGARDPPSASGDCPRVRRVPHSPLKLLAVVGLALLDHVHEVVGEDEGDPLPVDPKLGLEVPQKVAEVYVEELGGKQGNGSD